MKVLMFCPAKVVTGGVESIHKFACELNKVKDMDVKILYTGDKNDPQPPEYAEYGLEYVTEFPADYNEVVIFPEIMANEVTNPLYKNCIKVVHWLGVDVYYWNTPVYDQNKFLQRKDSTIHLTQLQYATDNLVNLGVDPNFIHHISDVPNEIFYQDFEEVPRNDLVLFNPNIIKLTDFQKRLMRAAQDRGIQFKPLENMTREEMAQTMRSAKLYIDFGVFSGRERIPREAVLSGCCVITSNLGCAKYFSDVALLDKWKFNSDVDEIPNIVDTMIFILVNYDRCKYEFDTYRQSVWDDRKNLPKECKDIAKLFMEYAHEI